VAQWENTHGPDVPSAVVNIVFLLLSELDAAEALKAGGM
jgi:hypothetical protein